MRFIVQLAFLSVFSLNAFTQTDLPPMKPIDARNSPARLAAQGFRRGVNLANDLEMMGWSRVNHTVVDLQEIRAEGFDHIRVPVGWHHYTGPAPDYKVSDDIFDKVDYFVTNANALGLNVIINLHHFNQFTTDPAANTDWFLAIWRQVAAHYAKAPVYRPALWTQSGRGFVSFQAARAGLAFELLNEPEDAATTLVINPIFAQAIKVIRQTNPTRTIFAGPGNYNSPDELTNFWLPDDDNIIVTLHCYEPFFFTHQGARWAGPDVRNVTGIHFPGPPSTPLEIDPDLDLPDWARRRIDRYNTRPTERNPSSPAAFMPKIKEAKDWSEKYGRPIHFGEFGAYLRADQPSRARYYAAMRAALEGAGFGWAIWDWKSGFNYWNPQKKEPFPGMREALFPKKTEK